jgi:hypothetical protein
VALLTLASGSSVDVTSRSTQTVEPLRNGSPGCRVGHVEARNPERQASGTRLQPDECLTERCPWITDSPYSNTSPPGASPLGAISDFETEPTDTGDACGRSSLRRRQSRSAEQTHKAGRREIRGKEASVLHTGRAG